jgi:hypothetical protein
MERERFEEIMKDEDIDTVFPENENALAGLNLIAKYLPKSGVEAAGHDIIYAADIDKIVKAGITEEDAIKLRSWNWMIDKDCECLACFV